MNYKNYIETTSLKAHYEDMAKELFHEWNVLYENICSYQDRDKFIEDFCKHLYDAKMKAIAKYPNVTMVDDTNAQKLGFFMGYFESTLTIHWKSVYYLKHQKDYDKILWLQALTIATQHIQEYQETVQQVYKNLYIQSQKDKDIFIHSDISLKNLIYNHQSKIESSSVDNNMLYMMTILLEKFDLKSDRLSISSTKYVTLFRKFMDEPLLKITEDRG
jgi:hypothetical protein